MSQHAVSSSRALASGDALRGALASCGVQPGSSAQLGVLREGAWSEVLIGAHPGEGTSSLHHLWCGTRPVVAAGALLRWEKEGMDPRAPLRTLGSPWSHLPLGATSLADLLAHEAPFVQPTLLEAQLIPSARLSTEAEKAARQAPADVVGFSEFTTWKLVDLWFERQGLVLSRLLEEEVIAPMGLEDEIVFDFDPSKLERLSQRIVPQRLNAGKRSYHTRVGWFASHERVAFGGYASTLGLVKFVALLGQVLGGRVVPGLPSPDFLWELFQARPARRSDAKLGRTCAFWAGCIVDLEDHGFAGLGPRAIGALGWQGRSFAVSDPDLDVSFALLLDGPLDRSKGFALRRAVAELVLS